MQKLVIKLFDFFSSVKLAVILILALAVILAVGTFYEAEHGTAAAHRVVYGSWYLTAEMFLLILNLACAAIDRYPWKKHHLGFVITHAGIITLLLGSFVTQQRGVDGSLPISIGQTADSFMVDETELHVYQSFDAKPFALLFSKPVDFASRPPEKHDYSFNLVDDDKLHIVQFLEKAERKADVKSSRDKKLGPAVFFRIANDRVNVGEWLGLQGSLPPFYDLGPAVVSIIDSKVFHLPQPANQIALRFDKKTGKLFYSIFSARAGLKPVAEGTVQVGKEIETGWMGLKFTVEKYFPHAETDLSFIEAPNDNPTAGPALAAKINEGPVTWFELDSPHEIRGTHSGYFLSYTRRRYDLGFQLTLKKFKMGTYGGTNMPMSYESTVSVNGGEEKLISMNEPLKHKDFTLYQASFEQNERGEPVESVFSINYDPGRKIKYLGAICIVAGIAIMFYLKPRFTRKKRTA